MIEAIGEIGYSNLSVFFYISYGNTVLHGLTTNPSQYEC